MHMLYGGYMVGWGLGDWVLMIVYWVLILSLISWAIGGYDSFVEEGKTPLDILKARYAKGGLGKEEFERMKKELA